MKVTVTNDERYPYPTIEISNSYGKVSVDIFTIENDEEWKDFISQLNQYRGDITEWLKLSQNNFPKK